MLNEFCQMTGVVQHDFENMWEEYQGFILKCAPLEDKRAVKKLIAEYNAIESECAGKRFMHVSEPQYKDKDL